MKRTIFIWDLHGCFDEFITLLQKIDYNMENDELYLTWDLINKWPKSLEILDFLLENPQIKAVKWNHEIYFLEFIDNKRKAQSCILNLSKLAWKKHIDYIRNLPSYIESQDWILLHGWLSPDKTLQEHTEYEIATIKRINDKPWYNFYKWEKTIIYGHFASDGLRVRENTIWLDTAAVYGKHLTAYIRETKEIIQVNAKKAYFINR